MGIALLLYLYDSSLLLYANEAVLVRAGRQRWMPATGWLGFVLAGRTVCVLNPFTPSHAAYRLRWDFGDLGAEQQDEAWSAQYRPLQAAAPCTLIAGAALFVVLPVGLSTPLGVGALITAAVLFYCSTVAALVAVYRARVFGASSHWPFVGFAFECLACPPFAVNMIRRITLAQRITEPWPRAARRLLDSDGWSQAKNRCIARVEETMQWVAADSPDAKRFEAQIHRLRSWTGA